MRLRRQKRVRMKTWCCLKHPAYEPLSCVSSISYGSEIEPELHQLDPPTKDIKLSISDMKRWGWCRIHSGKGGGNKSSSEVICTSFPEIQGSHRSNSSYSSIQAQHFGVCGVSHCDCALRWWQLHPARIGRCCSTVWDIVPGSLISFSGLPGQSPSYSTSLNEHWFYLIKINSAVCNLALRLGKGLV